jgi:hypothetical protein
MLQLIQELELFKQEQLEDKGNEEEERVRRAEEREKEGGRGKGREELQIPLGGE